MSDFLRDEAEQEKAERPAQEGDAAQAALHLSERLEALVLAYEQLEPSRPRPHRR